MCHEQSALHVVIKRNVFLHLYLQFFYKILLCFYYLHSFKKAEIYLQTKFRWDISIHGWDVIVYGFE